MKQKLMQLDLVGWLYGLGNAVIGGGAGAVTSTFTAAMIAPDKFNLGGEFGNTLKLILATFMINGMLNLFFYLKQSPLPSPVVTEQTTTVTTETRTTPKVTTTETETTVQKESK